MFIHMDLCRTTHLPASLLPASFPANFTVISLNYTLRANIQLLLVRDVLVRDACSTAEMTNSRRNREQTGVNKSTIVQNCSKRTHNTT